MRLRYRYNRPFPIALLLIGILGLFFPGAASAKLPYNTWFNDQQTGRMITTQPLYVPDTIIGWDGFEIPLSAPSDLYITENNRVYVADTGNNRIVELDGEGKFVREIGDADGDGRLNQPLGVFVTKDDTVYVADTGNNRIAVFDKDGRFERAYGKPESPLIPQEYFFVPSKIIVDIRGVMYIVVKDSYQGLMRLDENGKFTGFFGANKTQLSWLDRMKRAVLNKNQLSKEIAKRPGSIENVALTGDGFLVTASSGLSDGQLKRLNAGGTDAFQNKRFNEFQLSDAAVDRNNFLYGVNREHGEISIYDPQGSVLFYFGDTDKTVHQLGILSYPSSLAVSGDNKLWVADSAANTIQVFKRTAFGEAFLTAAKLYYEGRYAESKPYWEEVAKQNGMINLTFEGLGKISLHDKQYETAMAQFEDAYNAAGYSEAFWSLRFAWIKQYFLYAVVVLALALWGGRLLQRRMAVYAQGRSWPPLTVRYGRELRDAIYTMFHPYEGFYRLKERKISWVVLALIVVLAGGIRLISVYGMGFIFHPYDLSRVNLAMSMATLFAPWATWIAANYLVSAVKGGEGRLREVLQASAFALVPYIVLMIPVILFSHIVVLEERILVDSIEQIYWIWMMAMFFIMTQVIHNFDFLETVKNVLITIFTIAVIWIFIVIIAGLGYNLFDFAYQIFREVT
ncbi:YIP1 family protein [Paenibacillus spongiae]|uniref:YIP1 family protein n=1 Tax=Paenibacillus spongiae TaxID=2909671 RepID=A0ABY5S699_9BACL|nr:YIP1 family protein [Paenibacillus spongiae]UVI28360.1 YIP1 family protein [Paenibacillus spongiae]